MRTAERTEIVHGVTIVSRHGVERELIRMRKSVESLPTHLQSQIIEFFCDSKVGDHYGIFLRSRESAKPSSPSSRRCVRRVSSFSRPGAGDGGPGRLIGPASPVAWRLSGEMCTLVGCCDPTDKARLLAKSARCDHTAGRYIRRGHEFIDVRCTEVAENADDHASVDVVAEAFPSMRPIHRNKSAPSVVAIRAVRVVRQIAVCGSHDGSVIVADRHSRRWTEGPHKKRAENGTTPAAPMSVWIRTICSSFAWLGLSKSTKPSGGPLDMIGSEAASALARSARNTSQVSKRKFRPLR